MAVRLVPWAEGDLWVLRKKNAPEMTTHLGGPETEEKVLGRHQRYLGMDDPAVGRMFTVKLLPGGETVGTVGYWERVWQGETVYEAGWGILPQYQGRGLATVAAEALIETVRALGTHRHLHAYPSVDHQASNAICRKAGFTLLGEVEFEYPKGTFKASNDWCMALR